MRELTVRGIILGALITLGFTAANVYLGLRVGMTFASSIPAAVISMALLYRFKDSNILENNIVQTQASAAGTLSIVIFGLPALVMIQVWADFPFWHTFLICSAGGILGVLYTVPLRRVMVVESDLPYPEGVAAAEVLKVGDSQRHKIERATSIHELESTALIDEPSYTDQSGFLNFGLGAVIASIFGFLTNGLKIFGESINLWITGFGTIFRFSTSFSFALLAAGYLMGVTGGIAVLVGVFFGWGIVVPYLVSNVSIGVDQSLIEIANQTWNTRVRFLGAGVIAIAAIWTVGSLIRPIVKAIQQQTKSQTEHKKINSSDHTDQDLSNRSLVILGIISILVLILVVADFLQVHIPTLNLFWRYSLSMITVLLSVVFGFLVAAACGYMAGLVGSSSSPISGIGIIATILMGLVLLAAYSTLTTLNTTVSTQMISGLLLFLVSTILAMAAVSNDNLQDLKTGYLVGANPKKQQIALIIGCIVGAAVIAPVLNLLYQAYGFAGAMPRPDMNIDQALAAPQAALMQQIATGIFSGKLDYSMIVIGLIVGAITIVIDRILRSRGIGSLPPLAVGLGIYLPPAVNTMLGFGAVLSFIIKKVLSKRKVDRLKTEAAEKTGLLIASGFIVGESLIGLLLAGLIISSGTANPLMMNIGLSENSSLWLGGVSFFSMVAFFYYRVIKS